MLHTSEAEVLEFVSDALPGEVYDMEAERRPDSIGKICDTAAEIYTEIADEAEFAGITTGAMLRHINAIHRSARWSRLLDWLEDRGLC